MSDEKSLSRTEHIQNALDWLSNKKEECIYFTNEISLNDYPLIENDYINSVKCTNNSDIIRWLQEYAKNSDPLRSMIMCIIDSNDHPFPLLHFEAKNSFESTLYFHSERENIKKKILHIIENILVKLSFLLINS